MMATPLDLPTPVVPRMAKCRLTIVVDIDVHGDVGILLQVADVGMVGVGRAVDQAQLALAEQQRGVADVRIFDDAALEHGRAAVARANLADQIEARDLAEGRPGRGHRGLLVDVGDQADDHGFAGHHAHEFADGGLLAAGAARGEFDDSLRSGDGHHAADQIGSGAGRRMGRICKWRG